MNAQVGPTAEELTELLALERTKSEVLEKIVAEKSESEARAREEMHGLTEAHERDRRKLQSAQAEVSPTMVPRFSFYQPLFSLFKNDDLRTINSALRDNIDHNERLYREENA